DRQEPIPFSGKFAQGTLDCHPGVIPGMLSESSEGVKESGLAGVGVTDNRDGEAVIRSGARRQGRFRGGRRQGGCRYGHESGTLPLQGVKHDTPGFGAPQRHVEPADPYLHRIAERGETDHANRLPSGEAHFAQTLREPVNARNRANAPLFAWPEISKGLVHNGSMIMIFNFSVNCYFLSSGKCGMVSARAK